jgi:hypothetical protein
MEKKFNLKNGGFPPIKFCEVPSENLNVDNKKERFFQNNLLHNVNIRQLLSDNNKKIIIIPVENETLEVVDTFNRN